MSGNRTRTGLFFLACDKCKEYNDIGTVDPGKFPVPWKYYRKLWRFCIKHADCDSGKLQVITRLNLNLDCCEYAHCSDWGV